MKEGGGSGGRTLVWRRTLTRVWTLLSVIFFLGLEKNQTAPVPELQKPREPSNKEKEEAVQFSIEHKNGVGMIILPMDFLRILCNQR